MAHHHLKDKVFIYYIQHILISIFVVKAGWNIDSKIRIEKNAWCHGMEGHFKICMLFVFKHIFIADRVCYIEKILLQLEREFYTLFMNNCIFVLLQGKQDIFHIIRKKARIFIFTKLGNPLRPC